MHRILLFDGKRWRPGEIFLQQIYSSEKFDYRCSTVESFYFATFKDLYEVLFIYLPYLPLRALSSARGSIRGLGSDRGSRSQEGVSVLGDGGGGGATPSESVCVFII